ncbi:MAG: hypothetical protein J3Q66DRAFT_345749 [Benniella sp.]|nr:MAG: hypothetical protein J3Q66DRAFT_345749 [Benniella sp.]
MWPHRNSQRAGCWLSIVLILQSLALLLQPVDANIFGVLVARLGYDIVSVKNNPINIHNLELIDKGNDLPLGIISKTAGVPTDGLSGLLYDFGYGCQPAIDPNTTLPTPNLYNLPKVALIRRGSADNNINCTYRTKILSALADGAAAAIVYNGPGFPPIEAATVSMNDADAPIDIPGLYVSYEGGLRLKSFLQEQSNTTTGPNSYNRVRINLSADRKMPVIWEFVLIVVVILLGLSFTVSVVLHCRLYALRQRYRAEALARGGDILPNGTIRVRTILEKSELDQFPVRIFGQSNSSSGSASVPVASGPETTLQRNDSCNTKTGALSRANSFSNRSIRSVKALAAAEALDFGSDTDQPAHEIINDMCAICIDEFVEGDEIRTLPCHHDFHLECIDPWLTRRSATCPLCKYECKIQSSEIEESSSDEESTAESRTSLPNDRLMVFIMGPDWVAARTHHHHNGTSWIDRIGDFFGRMSDRVRGRPLRSSTPHQQPAATSVSREDGNSELPLQLITGARPAMTSRSTGSSSVHPDASVLVPIPPLVHVNPSSRSQSNGQIPL